MEFTKIIPSETKNKTIISFSVDKIDSLVQIGYSDGEIKVVNLGLWWNVLPQTYKTGLTTLVKKTVSYIESINQTDITGDF